MPERLVQVFPRSLFNKFEFISGGATGWVFEVAPGIALKYLCPGREDEFRRENETYALMERSDPPPPPHFIQSFLRLPYAHFMQLMPGSLDSRLRANRRQDPKTLKCFEVLRLEPTAKIEQWAAELSSALAWLESIELVQGDLRPSNLLLDSEDHMKLVDFDSCAKIGDLDPGLPPPWSSPNYHLYGAETEQFGFGSILYNITHGLEPYEDKGPEAVELFRTGDYYKEIASGLITARLITAELIIDFPNNLIDEICGDLGIWISANTRLGPNRAGLGKSENGLSHSNKAARAAKSALAAEVEEFFKSSSASSRSTIINVLNKFDGCGSHVLAYTQPSRSDLYWDDLPAAITRGCHSQDQATTTLDETTHLREVAGTADNGYGYDNIRKLTTTQSLNNADSYAVFAKAIYAGC